MRIVIADDVMLTREGISRLLTEAGLDVTRKVGEGAALLEPSERLAQTQP